MTSHMLPILLGSTVLLAVLCCVLGVVYHQQIRLPERRKAIQRKLIDPYLRLQSSGNLEEAYRTHTSEAFRTEFSLVTYKEHFGTLQASNGARKTIKLIAVRAPFSERLGRGSYRLTYLVHFEQAVEKISLDVIKTADQYLINRSYVHTPEQILKPRPW